MYVYTFCMCVHMYTCTRVSIQMYHSVCNVLVCGVRIQIRLSNPSVKQKWATEKDHEAECSMGILNDRSLRQ